jgi:hypothetical protein
LVPGLGEAPHADAAHVSEAKYADFHGGRERTMGLCRNLERAGRFSV